MLNLERLRVLHAVSGAGSVRGAAATLHVTTSAVSQQLARLEREVGQVLIERQGRGIRLTDAGVVLAEHAGRLLDEVERVEADLAGRRGAVVGTLTVAAFATAARGLLPAALCALRAAHPRLSVRLAEWEPTEAIPALSRGDVDVAVVQDWAEAPLTLPDGLSRKHLLDDNLDVALPADHPLAGRESVTLAELAGAEWITWTSGQICSDWLRETLAGQGFHPRLGHTASEHSTQLALVAAGIGVAIIPRLGREPAPDGVRLVAVRPCLRRRVSVLWRASAQRRPAVRAVVGALEKSAGTQHMAPPGGRDHMLTDLSGQRGDNHHGQPHQPVPISTPRPRTLRNSM
ncbi:MAG: LysR family transcriptional regulator [Labedaea sp.]